MEASCEDLSRRGQILRPVGLAEWPDGTVTARYAFQHALHQEVASQRLGPSQRVHLHRRLGARLEAGYGAQVPGAAAGGGTIGLSALIMETEAAFQRALDVARRQEAKMLERRAAVSLNRLWQHRGKSADARHVLPEVYCRFSEGFDTQDLQEAGALLRGVPLP